MFCFILCCCLLNYAQSDCEYRETTICPIQSAFDSDFESTGLNSQHRDLVIKLLKDKCSVVLIEKILIEEAGRSLDPEWKPKLVLDGRRCFVMKAEDFAVESDWLLEVDASIVLATFDKKRNRWAVAYKITGRVTAPIDAGILPNGQTSATFHLIFSFNNDD